MCSLQVQILLFGREEEVIDVQHEEVIEGHVVAVSTKYN